MLKIFLGVEHLLNIMGAATTFWGTAFGGQTTVKTGHCIPKLGISVEKIMIDLWDFGYNVRPPR